jgi:hypothetical protein
MCSILNCSVYGLNPTSHRTDPFNLLQFVSQAMLFTSFSSEKIQDFKTELHKAAVGYKSQNISFLLGDPITGQGAFQV